MNFLIHCWLGREDEGLVAGGFLGDYIKGQIPSELPVELRRGIQLHRFIDVESNRLPEMRSTYKRFGERLRRPAPILLDLVADHIFAKYWSHYTSDNLHRFTNACYATIGRYEVPPNAQGIYRYACRSNLFARYADLDVVYNISRRILSRLKFANQAGELARILVSEETNFRSDFDVYFPLLQAKVTTWRQQHLI